MATKPAKTENTNLAAELAKLRKENEALKAQAERKIFLKVSEKGGLSVYGLARFPLTLYVEQWEKVLGMTDEIAKFLKDNAAALKRKE